MKRPWIFFKAVWNGVIGILYELTLVLFFIFVGFLICLLWWGIFK